MSCPKIHVRRDLERYLHVVDSTSTLMQLIADDCVYHVDPQTYEP